jgi:hypothetical protein
LTRIAILAADNEALTRSISDHAPLIAEFDMPFGIPARPWDTESFTREIGIRHGAAAGKVAEDIIEWAKRKDSQIKMRHPYASLDPLPISEGADPELWVQLDLRYPDRIGYTISLRANGTIRLQFRYMNVPPLDTVEA